MIIIASVLILTACLVLFRKYVATLPPRGAFAYILTVPFILYVLNYPVRAILLQLTDLNDDYQYADPEILEALLYSFAFFLIVYFTYDHYSQRNAINDATGVQSSDDDGFLLAALCVIVLIVYLYKLSTGRLYGLYEDVADLYADFSTNFILQFDVLKWFCAPLAFLVADTRKDRRFFYLGLALVVIIMLESLASTAKGPILALVLLYFYYKGLKRAEVSSAIYLSIPVIVVFMVATYIVRYYGEVRGSFTMDTFLNNLEVFAYIVDIESAVEAAVLSVANRFNLLDGLMMAMRSAGQVDKGLYGLGGIAEILNVFPRFVWSERPLVNFNIFLTQEVWGGIGVSETPIGRAGESFFVLGYVGLIYAFFYGYVFAWVENHLAGKYSAVSMAFYFLFLYYYVWSDAHILLYWKSILWAAVTIYSVLALKRMFYPSSVLQRGA